MSINLMIIAKRFAASALSKPARFYKMARVVTVKDGGGVCTKYNIFLDKKILKTPRRNLVEVDSNCLAVAIAQEWNNQSENINMDLMRLTGLAITVIDNPNSLNCNEIVSNTLEFLMNDTLLYRASDSKLSALQSEKWDPILKWANNEFGLRLEPIYGICDDINLDHFSSEELRNFLLTHSFPALIGLIYAVGSCKSLLLALAVMAKRLNVSEAVELALLEQNYQTEIWGKIEWSHDIEREELVTRLAAGVLFAYMMASKH